MSYIDIPAAHDMRQFIERPGVDTFDRLKSAVARGGAAAESSIESEISDLAAMTNGVDVLHLLSTLHMVDSFRRYRVSGAEGFGSDAMLDFFAGVVVSRPESDVLAHLRKPFDPQLILDVDNKLRVIANLQASIDMAQSYRNVGHSALDSAISLLKMEHHFDRMSGFEPHLRRIASEVFKLTDDKVLAELGFRFSDAIRFADAYTKHRMLQWDSADDELEQIYPPFNPQADEQAKAQWRIGHMLYFGLMAAAPVEMDIADQLASEIGISQESFGSLVTAMATQLGSQTVVDLHSDNAIRSRPILQLSTGEWMWCRPNDFAHGIFDWALTTSASSAKLTSAFDKARQTVAERLPQRLLSNIFGDRVHCSVTYPTEESDAETDTVVTLAAANLVLESKGGRFTPPARRGAPKRVETHAKNIITKGADQCLRTTQAIVDGLPLKDQRGVLLKVDRSGDCLGLVVTFDRIDPFNTHLGRPTNDDLTKRCWIVPLADLLMIAEILPHPAEFFAYAQRRIEMVRAESHFSLVEADVLGAWCENRLNAFSPMAVGAPTIVNETSESMNAFFTRQAVGEFGLEDEDYSVFGPAPKPTSGVPKEVLVALDQLLARDSELWPLRCRQTFDVPPSEWRLLTRRLAIARNPARYKGRDARKKLAQIQRGMLIGGILPVQLASDDLTPEQAEFLVIAP